jgi:hypothetical protein
MCKKYKIAIKGANLNGNQKGKKPKISRLIDGQVRLHVDTEQLKKNVNKINQDDNITITYKLHGTSGWVSNVLVKRKLSLFERILIKLGVNIDQSEYDYVYGSRKVVKNSNMREERGNFYDCDIWAEVKDELKDSLPKGYTIYYEIVGFTKSGGAIQKLYDYGCKQGEKKVFVYRITVTNKDGQSIDLSSDQIIEFCSRYGLNFVPVLFKGKASDFVGHDIDDYVWRAALIKEIVDKHTDKDCFMCVNKTPEEGIVLRKEKMFEFEAYKLKSFRFFQYETEMLDKGEVDIESIN